MKKGFLVSVFIVLIVNIYKAQVNFTEDEPKIVAQLKIIDNGSGKRNRITDLPTGYAGKIGIEIRGSSSQMFPKKQYGFEIYNDAEEGINVSLLGLPKEEDWILNAPYTDKSLIRNALAYKWGSALGNYAPRTKFCEVVINGAYKGVFKLTEKIKRDNNRVNISKLDATTTTGNALTGGYIIKIDKHDFNLFKSGIYKSQGNKRSFNGKASEIIQQICDKFFDLEPGKVSANNIEETFGVSIIEAMSFGLPYNLVYLY